MKPLILLVFLCSVWGCSSSDVIQTNLNPKITFKVAPEKVKVYIREKIDRPYEILGLVAATKEETSDPSKVIEMLRRRAVQIGADALVGLRLEYRPGFFKRLAIHGEAKAVSLR